MRMSDLRRWCRTLAVGGMVAVFSAGAGAAIIPATVPIPASEVLIDFNGTGLDWAYAGPVIPDAFGPGQIEGPSFRAAEGWRFATADEWALRPTWSDFVKPGSEGGLPFDYGTSHDSYRYTSEYWSDFSHVDPNDVANGFVTNGSDLGSILVNTSETWYVRATRANAVPEPGSFAMLAAGGLSAWAFARRRRAHA